MKAIGDIESVNLSTGERRQRVTGNGESFLRSCPCEPRLGPRQPSEEELQERAWQLADLIIVAEAKLKGQNMHYRNGREAKNGDKIVQLDSNGNAQVVAVGILHGATPGNDYCNGSIAPIQNPITGACMCDCLHADDLAALLKEKGLDKRPSGK